MSDALDAAKQGNPSAIAALLTHHLRSRSLKVKAASAADCLNLLVEADELPDQQWGTAQIIHKVKMSGVETTVELSV